MRFITCVLVLAMLGTHTLLAQGVTTAAISGQVLDAGGAPVSGARVELRRAETGAVAIGVTDDDGRFYLPNLRPGVSLSLVFSHIGFTTVTREGVRLRLSQTLHVDVTLTTQPVTLPELAVRLETDPEFDSSRMGVSTRVDAPTLERLPTITHDFLEFAQLSPLAKVDQEGVSIGGSSMRLNAIQIDGALNQDVFGLSPSGVAGGQARGRLIPLAAIQELEVLIAPYDVRQSGFTGGVINAVTRSGTNRWQGSAFAFRRDETFVGDLVVAGVERKPDQLDNLFAGFTLGGPIIKNRLHLFAAGELEQRRRPPDGFQVGLDDPLLTRISPDSMARLQNLLRGYGVDPGEAGSFTLDNDLANLFVRLDLTINERNSAMVRYNFAAATDDPAPNRLPGEPFELASNGTEIQSRNHSFVGQLLSDLGRGWSNDLLVNVQLLRDDETPRGNYPRVEVDLTSIEDGNVLVRRVRAGADLFAQQSALDQDILQISDGLTLARGSHRLLVGGSFERFAIDRLFLPGSLGSYRFDSLADLEANLPSRYDLNLVTGDEQPRARFSVNQWAAYVQDEWRVNDALTLRMGLRVDVPILANSPAANPQVAEVFDHDTSVLPSGNPLFSPRAGFNLRLGADRGTQIRGGVGLFAGRPPFAWLASAFLNNGLKSAFLSCERTIVSGQIVELAPRFDPGGPAPTVCRDGSGPEAARPTINVFDETFRFPQDYRASLSIDQRLPGGLVGTLEGVYTKAVHQLALKNLNMGRPVSSEAKVDSVGFTDGFGFGSRGAFGDPIPEGFEPRRRSDLFGPVIEVGNRSVNFAYAVTASLRRRFGERLFVEAGYAFNRSADAQSLFTLDPTSNFGLTPVEGNPNDPQTRPAIFDRPHKVVVNSSIRILEHLGGTEIAVLYIGQSGAPYSFVYLGDVNGDGFPGGGQTLDFTNDLIFVPELPSSFPGLGVTPFIFESLVGVEPCLQQNRGRIVSRNACRTAWSNQVNVRITQNIRVGRGHAQIFVDMLNVLNFIDQSWGIVERTNPVIQIIRVPGRDPQRGDTPTPQDPLFGRHNGPVVGSFDEGFRAVRPALPSTPASQWQLQLGVRISFN